MYLHAFDGKQFDEPCYMKIFMETIVSLENAYKRLTHEKAYQLELQS